MSQNPFVKSIYEGFGTMAWHADTHSSSTTKSGIASGKASLELYFGPITQTFFYNLAMNIGNKICNWTKIGDPTVNGDFVMIHCTPISSHNNPANMLLSNPITLTVYNKPPHNAVRLAINQNL
jgi:hypothetical protein